MSKIEEKAKYGRIANDPSQLQMFKNAVIDGELNGLPEIPADVGDKTLVLKYEAGELAWGEASGGSAQTPVKGGYVIIDSHRYLVLDANEDLTEVKLMFADFNGSKYYDASLGSEMLETFTTADGTKQGLKYAGSTLDTYCNETFLATLPQEVQDAIIEQTVVQDMYAAGFVDAGETTVLQTKQIGASNVYRVNKISTESVAVGQRKIRSLNVADICAYLGTDGQTVLDGEVLNEMVFGFAGVVAAYSWLLDAYSDYSYNACYVNGNNGNVNNNNWINNYLVRPTFTINWKSIN